MIQFYKNLKTCDKLAFYMYLENTLSLYECIRTTGMTRRQILKLKKMILKNKDVL